MSPIHIIRFLASFMPSIGKARRADALLVVLFGLLCITVSLGLAGCGDAAPDAAPALTNTPAPTAAPALTNTPAPTVAPIPVACGPWPRCSEKFWRTADEPSVRAELDAGASIEARDANGATPLHWAAEGGNAEVTGLLIDRGADIEARDSDGATPLHWAAGLNGNPGVTGLLIDRGAGIEARDSDGETPLQYAAAFNGNPEVLRLLRARQSAQ